MILGDPCERVITLQQGCDPQAETLEAPALISRPRRRHSRNCQPMLDICTAPQLVRSPSLSYVCLKTSELVLMILKRAKFYNNMVTLEEAASSQV